MLPLQVDWRPDDFHLLRDMKFAALVLSCLMAVTVSADKGKKTLSALAIGNSFSDPVWKSMPPVAAAMGCELDIASAMIGGADLKKHWNKFLEAQTNANYRPYSFHRSICGKSIRGTKVNLIEALMTNDWDVVTVQQASHCSMLPRTYAPYGDDLVSAIRKICPKAKIYVQETWYYLPFGAKDLASGVAQQREEHDKIVNAYADFARRVSADGIIPMGSAVQLFRNRLPVVYRENDSGGDVVGNNLSFEKDETGHWRLAKGSDFCHLGPEGEYLQALVWTAKLFGVDVRECPSVAPSVRDPSRAALMKACAALAVMGGREGNRAE